MNLANALEDNIKKFDEYTSWIFEDNEFTNVEINQQANKLANGLSGLGVKRGDRVMVLMRNCPEVIICFLATWELGAIAMPTIFILSPEEIAYNLQDSGAETIVTDSESYHRKVERIRSQVPELRNIILVDEKLAKTVFYHDLVDEGSEKFKTVETDDDEIALLLYTAGTTGKPKGVMRTHLSDYIFGCGTSDAFLVPGENSRDFTSLLALPLSHSFGVLVMLYSFFWGNKNIVMRKFDAEEALKTIQKHKVKLFSAVPTMVTRLMEVPGAEKYVNHGVHFDFGGAPLPVELVRDIMEKLKGTVTFGYGTTESGVPTQHLRTIPVEPEKIARSIGLAMFPAVELRIFDGADNELPFDEIGELVVRGPTVMKGYWNRPDLTKKTLRNGWYHTGDLGYRDKRGYFYLTGRKDDLIIRGGENVYPAEVEDVLYTHPKVLEATVIGVPDKKYGEEVKAFVVLKQREKATEEEVKEYCRQQLAYFKIPRIVEFIDDLPKSSVGKVLKRELRKDT